MILYSKSGNFLGIGKDELSFLGYEDLDEFKSIHSDVADLFVNRPNYIFKFKNFSWIDYALHSGAPKKSVIIKLKTGNEVEVPLRIKELFLYAPEGNEELYYSVEFVNNTTQSSSSAMNDSSSTQTTPSSEPTSFSIMQEEPNIQTKDKKNFDTSSLQEKEDKEPTLKLKTYGKILGGPETEVDLTENSKPSQHAVDMAFDYLPEEETEEKIEFDLMECVDELGLNISLLSELIADYMERISKTIPTIKTSINNEDEKDEKDSIYKLKGISDNLRMFQLSEKLENILKATDTTSKQIELEKFEKFVAKFQGELI